MPNESYIADNKGSRDNAGKVRLGLLPPDALLALGAVYTSGAQKYAPRNWERGMNFSDVIDSLLRHSLTWMSGEDTDKESGHLHMAHVAWNALALVAYQLRQIGVDDRQRLVKSSLLKELEEQMKMARKSTVSELCDKYAARKEKEPILGYKKGDVLTTDGPNAWNVPAGWEVGHYYNENGRLGIGDTVMLNNGMIHVIVKTDTSGNVFTVRPWEHRGVEKANTLIHRRSIACPVKQAENKYRCVHCDNDAEHGSVTCKECAA